MSYATAEEVSDWMNLDTFTELTGTEQANQTAKLDIALGTARDIINAHCRRNFDPAVSEARVYKQPRGLMYASFLEIDDCISVSEVYDVDGEETVDADDYELAPRNSRERPFTRLERLDEAVFEPSRRYRVTGKFGWRTVPASVKMATIMLASRLFQRHGSPLGVDTGGEVAMYIRTSDPDIERALATYVSGRGGVA